ncbi:amidohydrolase family protein [Streptomyces sp. NPDC059468]|uniref:amidohydrolase family protein n=1 Tax=Streptomyces sp. NPDC059468 TaxID=3346845 RepID=UPI003679C2D1
MSAHAAEAATPAARAGAPDRLTPPVYQKGLLVEAVVPRPTGAEVRARTAEVLNAMAAAGLTGGHAMDANGESLSVYAALEAEGALPPHGPGQALTALQALQGITVNAAWAAGEEHLAGRLAVGRRADLTVPAENPLEVPDTEPARLPVVRTVLAGRPTHRAAGL